jgi:hypothetical protein
VLNLIGHEVQYVLGVTADSRPASSSTCAACATTAAECRGGVLVLSRLAALSDGRRLDHRQLRVRAQFSVCNIDVHQLRSSESRNN